MKVDATPAAAGVKERQMKLATALKVARFAELESGDLFLLPQPEGSCVAIAAVDGDDSAEKLAILLGPTFPYGLIGPHLMPLSGATVISFGKDFAVRLPVQADAWCETAPPKETHCLLVTDQGVYVRASFANFTQRFSPCYVDLATGRVCVGGSGIARQYTLPPGTRAFAVCWEIVTAEAKPRTILSYPYSSRPTDDRRSTN